MISGRPARTVVEYGQFDRVPGLLVLGHYGRERWEAGELTVPPTHPGVAVARQEIPAVLARVGAHEGVWTEEKGEAIAHPWVNKALEKAQQKVEARNFEMRKNILKYDNVLNDQRKVIFEQRKEIMSSDDVSDQIADMRPEPVIGWRDVRSVGALANGTGKDQKSFGRIFYTEGKSLIFYAFDLDDKRVTNASYSFEAWGERLGQPSSVKSLGVLYVDDKAQRRWSLKVDDPHQLAGINSVFVTLEPHAGDGKPQGKRILFAFLGGEANHP